MEKGVLYKTLAKNHANRIVLATVALRDETEIAKTFLVLQSVRTVDEMKKALDFYENEGYSNVIAIPIFEDDNNPELKKFPPEIAAKLFRTIYHA